MGGSFARSGAKGVVAAVALLALAGALYVLGRGADRAVRAPTPQDVAAEVPSLEAAPVATFERERAAVEAAKGADAPLEEAAVAVAHDEPVSLVRGRVVDSAGRPIEGAAVLRWPGRYRRADPHEHETTSGPDGRFEIEVGPEFRLEAAAPGLACRQALHGALVRGSIAEGGLELVLVPAGKGSGRVLGARGEGLAARLWVEGSVNSSEPTDVAGVQRFVPVDSEVRADAEGRFEVGPLPAGAVYPMRARHEGHLHAFARISVESSPIEIRMDPGASVVGRVTDPRGEPVAGARVQGGGEGMETARTTTREDGSYALGGLIDGSVYVGVVADGFAPLVRDGIEVAAERPRTLDLVLEPGLPLGGRVVDGAGAPLAGARVTLEGDRLYERHYVELGVPPTHESFADRGETLTATDGSFRVDDLYPGEFVVRVFAPEGGEVHAELVARTPVEGLLVRFDRSELERVVLCGTVRDALSGEPLRAFVVTPMVRDEDGWSGRGVTVEDARGRFRLAGYPAEEMHLTVSATGYAPWTSPARAFEAGEHEHDVALGPLRTVDVELYQRDGSRPRRARATFARLDGTRAWVEAGGGTTDGLALSEGAGRAVGLPGERLRVTFAVAEMEEETFDLDLRAQPAAPIAFYLGTSAAPDVRVGLLVAALAPRADEADFAELDEPALVERYFRRLGLEPLDSAAHLEARDARGETLLAIEIEPKGDAWAIRTGRFGHGTGSEGERNLPLFGSVLPGATRELVVNADGRAERRFVVDPAAENAGLPRLIALRPAR